MTRDEIEMIPDKVKSGKLSWEQVIKELVVFIVKNKPMFGLQKFDEDFISDFIIMFLIRAKDSLSDYDTSRGSFFSYLFCMVKNISVAIFKQMAVQNKIDYHNIHESIMNYDNKIEAYKHINFEEFERPKVPYNYKPVSYKDFQIACKTDSYQIKRVFNTDELNLETDIKEKLKGFSPKIIKNIVMVLALKSSYYITDTQVEQICQMFNLNPSKMFQIIQEIKIQMETRISNKEKIEIRRNKAYFHHKTLREQIEWNSISSNDSEYENAKLKPKYDKKTKCWETLNHQLEEGKIHIRPTTKLIAKVLGMSPRQVTYYQSTARKLGIKIRKV